MTPEITYLAFAVLLLIAHMLVQALASDLSRGIMWGLGSRDEDREPSILAGRLERALNNYAHNIPAFIALALALEVTELGDDTTALGAAIWFWARFAYVPAYALNVLFVRSITWFVSLGGLALMIAPLLGW